MGESESAFDKTVILTSKPEVINKLPPPKARLVCVNPDKVVGSEGREILLESGEFTIGRGDENSITLKADGISLIHAFISAREGEWWIQDMGSTNGTHVGGKKVSESTLKPGDEVKIGKARYRYSIRLEDGTYKESDNAINLTGSAASPSPATKPHSQAEHENNPTQTEKHSDAAKLGIALLIIGAVLLAGVLMAAYR